jgi:peroxiredoxin (alkyl hydroperoxide reductase subunit C)
MSETAFDAPSPVVIGQRPPVIGSKAPNFSARTTMGERTLESYRGRWLVFFSHPADFTPVCTSEFITFAKLYPEFQKLDCELLGLSVDSLSAHIAWVHSIKARFGVTMPFPIVEDPSMAIAAAYGMIHPDASDAATVRATFVIDPEGLVRAIVWYPMTTGRSVEELLRLVQALRTSDAEHAWTPEGWHPGGNLLEPAPIAFDPTIEHQSEADAPDWYYRFRKE